MTAVPADSEQKSQAMFNMLWRYAKQRRTEKAGPVRKRTRPAVEQLEGRTVPSSVAQITFSSGILGYESPSIDAAGTRIAFQSVENFTGRTSNGISQIFLYDRTTGVLSQITSSVGGESLMPRINAAGTRIAFESNADLTGHNPDGNFEVFLYDTTTATLSQITSSAGGAGSRHPS